MNKELKAFVEAYAKTRKKQKIKVFNFNTFRNEKPNLKVSPKAN
ncbi:hypothetical protein JSO59_004085 [Riemerella anatipestifer]